MRFFKDDSNMRTILSEMYQPFHWTGKTGSMSKNKVIRNLAKIAKDYVQNDPTVEIKPEEAGGFALF